MKKSWKDDNMIIKLKEENGELYSGLELRPSVAQALDIFKEALKH